MNILIDRLPFIGNEKMLTDYWENHIPDWKIGANSILFFAKDAAKQLWLYVAIKDRDVYGMLVNEETDATSTLWLLHVIEEHRKNGIGGKLFDYSSKNTGNQWTAGIGSGYWWQGVPLECGDQFLEKKGFQWSWTSVDMLMNLNDWQTPGQESNFNISRLLHHESNELIDLLKDEEDLSEWTYYYQSMIDNLAFDQILVSRSNHKIVGCVMILAEEEIRWKDMIKGKVGGVGCLGVRKNYRDQGIGASLVYEVNNGLKKRGFTYSYIGYTWLEMWYGKMGYKVFNRQRMGFLPCNHK